MPAGNYQPFTTFTLEMAMFLQIFLITVWPTFISRWKKKFKICVVKELRYSLNLSDRLIMHDFSPLCLICLNSRGVTIHFFHKRYVIAIFDIYYDTFYRKL
jgi:hypothetical protein